MSDHYCNCEVCGELYSELSSHRGPTICWDCSKLPTPKQISIQEKIQEIEIKRYRQVRKTKYMKLRIEHEEFEKLHEEFSSEVDAEILAEEQEQVWDKISN